MQIKTLARRIRTWQGSKGSPLRKALLRWDKWALIMRAWSISTHLSSRSKHRACKSQWHKSTQSSLRSVIVWTQTVTSLKRWRVRMRSVRARSWSSTMRIKLPSRPSLVFIYSSCSMVSKAITTICDSSRIKFHCSIQMLWFCFRRVMRIILKVT